MRQIRFHTLPLLTLLLAAPTMLLAASVEPDDSTLWERTQEKSGEVWEATREGTVKGIDWTREKSGQAWQATREGAAKGAEWTREKSGQAWEATKEGTAKGAEWVKEKIGPDESKEETGQPATTPPL